MPRKSLISMIKTASKKEDDRDIAEEFKNDLIYTIEHAENDHKPSKTISPSSCACSRQACFKLAGFEEDVKKGSASLSIICTIGSATHEALQSNFLNLKKYTYVDVGKYIKEKKLNLKIVKPSNFEEGIYETHLHACLEDGTPVVSFLVDGIIKTKDSKYYIVEIKTTSSNTLFKQEAPQSKHLAQAQLYSLLLGIPSVLFIYVGREVANIRTFLYRISDEEREAMKNKCQRIIDSVRENKIVAKPQDIDKNKLCMYCNYRKTCNKIGEGEYKYDM